MAAQLFWGMNGIGFVNPNIFHLLTYRWRASQLIKSMPASDLPQVRAKVAAMEMLKGQRADLGLQRAWEGNYLASVRPGEQSTIDSCSLYRKDLQKGKNFSARICGKNKTPTEAKLL